MTAVYRHPHLQMRCLSLFNTGNARREYLPYLCVPCSTKSTSFSHHLHCNKGLDLICRFYKIPGTLFCRISTSLVHYSRKDFLRLVPWKSILIQIVNCTLTLKIVNNDDVNKVVDGFSELRTSIDK